MRARGEGPAPLPFRVAWNTSQTKDTKLIANCQLLSAPPKASARERASERVAFARFGQEAGSVGKRGNEA